MSYRVKSIRALLDCHASMRKNPAQKWDMQTEYQIKLRRDSWLIKEHYSTRVRRSGLNLLNTPELKRRYPEVDNFNFSD